MPSKISDREYVLRVLQRLEGKTNQVKAKAISRLLGGRITQRLREQGKDPANSAIPVSDRVTLVGGSCTFTLPKRQRSS
jgi:cell division FtsZ-interacting protein ZapD